MHVVRSGIAIAAGFLIFSVVFRLLGPGLGAVLTTGAAGVIAGYLTVKLAPSRPMLHGGATAGLVAASLIAQPVFAIPVRLIVAALSVLAITAGAWIRAQARGDRSENMSEQSRSPQGDGGEERS